MQTEFMLPKVKYFPKDAFAVFAKQNSAIAVPCILPNFVVFHLEDVVGMNWNRLVCSRVYFRGVMTGRQRGPCPQFFSKSSDLQKF